MPPSNRMSRLLRKLDLLPNGLRKRLRSFLLGRLVPFVGTAKLSIDEISPERVVISIRNRRRVRNHLKGIHAAAMALLAETATGFAVAMHVPDDKVPVIKSLKIDYVKRAQGDLRAVVELGPEQAERIVSEEKGEISVPVSVTDQSGRSPIECDVIWAWVPKKRG
jgi:acyl-coenzyme A thioesterase PaaI-like protein